MSERLCTLRSRKGKLPVRSDGSFDQRNEQENTNSEKKYGLTCSLDYAYTKGIMKSCSVRQAAKLIEVDPQTLFGWLWAGKVKASIVVPIDHRNLQRFIEADVKKARRYKVAHYWEGRGARRKKEKKR